MRSFQRHSNAPSAALVNDHRPRAATAVLPPVLINASASRCGT